MKTKINMLMLEIVEDYRIKFIDAHRIFIVMEWKKGGSHVVYLSFRTNAGGLMDQG